MLGPPPGRYLLRERAGDEPQQIVVLETLGAPERRLLRGRRSKQVEPEPQPEPVATSRATVIDTDALADRPAAEAWLRRLDLDAACSAALAALNRVMHAHRIATADPHVHELARADAIAVRAGFGSGEHVADGRWAEARQAPVAARARIRRSAALQPTERLAALLGARDVALQSEELALRARLDLDAGRTGAAALGVRLTLEAALVELAPERDSAALAGRLQELHELRDSVVAAANAALVGPLSEEQEGAVVHALRRIEALLRARTVATLHR